MIINNIKYSDLVVTDSKGKIIATISDDKIITNDDTKVVSFKEDDNIVTDKDSEDNLILVHW